MASANQTREAAGKGRSRENNRRRVSSGERLNAHSEPGKLRTALARRGVRLTRQRRVLLDIMDQAEQHLTADSILERAQKIDPRVHRVTVYRTLEMLKSHGLLDELDLLHIHGHRHYYESHGPRDHIHVACLGCGKVREVESDLFEQLKRQVERDTGIGITVARVEIGGYCDDCRMKPPGQHAAS
ncbi:MAG: transcriptional repressor [Acidobacteria bacterium]|nr:MAG: transcriptional repressor [Acidobacteriota bacterium]